jgi:hypothetical protein
LVAAGLIFAASWEDRTVATDCNSATEIVRGDEGIRS